MLREHSGTVVQRSWQALPGTVAGLSPVSAHWGAASGGSSVGVPATHVGSEVELLAPGLC